MENMDKRKFRNGMIIYLLILIVAFILINRWMQSDKIEVTTTYSYTDLTEDLDDGKILALSIQPQKSLETQLMAIVSEMEDTKNQISQKEEELG